MEAQVSLLSTMPLQLCARRRPAGTGSRCARHRGGGQRLAGFRPRRQPALHQDHPHRQSRAIRCRRPGAVRVGGGCSSRPAKRWNPDCAGQAARGRRSRAPRAPARRRPPPGCSAPAWAGSPSRLRLTAVRSPRRPAGPEWREVRQRSQPPEGSSRRTSAASTSSRVVPVARAPAVLGRARRRAPRTRAPRVPVLLDWRPAAGRGRCRPPRPGPGSSARLLGLGGDVLLEFQVMTCSTRCAEHVDRLAGCGRAARRSTPAGRPDSPGAGVRARWPPARSPAGHGALAAQGAGETDEFLAARWAGLAASVPGGARGTLARVRRSRPVRAADSCG